MRDQCAVNRIERSDLGPFAGNNGGREATVGTLICGGQECVGFAAWYSKQIIESPQLRRTRVNNRSTVPFLLSRPQSTAYGSGELRVWLPFRIYKVQTDGNLHFVVVVQAFDDAKERVRELGKLWPGEYVIDNEETGERVFVSTEDETKN